MKKYTPKMIIRILTKDGWIERRIRGSHHIFTKEGEENIVVVPTTKKIIPIGTLKNIEKQAKLKL
ncbi:MAG: type II toxin-antitoxin system HicA family toxin [Clostridia bacterium]|jgi:predicted RNA binding protein YcfA (HicA-like mRNA interferase family)|nr:type II toxin-antitoxin system HicA family toxin [Clostridia bacterium]